MHRVLFLQPLNRVAAAHLESASEVLCDDWAVERTDRPLALARCLTEVAGWVASPLGASVPAMARRGSGLGRRVRRLVAAGDDPSPPRRRDRWPVPFAAGALTLVVFAAPGATEMASSAPPAAMPPAPRLVPASVSPGEVMAERSPDAARASAPDKKRDARRLLEKLRGGQGGNHDLSDWVALAQLLGSPGQGQALRVGDDSDADIVSDPMFSGDDIADLIEGSISRALSGTGVDVDFDFDFDTRGFDLQVNGIDVLALRGGDEDDDVGRERGLRCQLRRRGPRHRHRGAGHRRRGPGCQHRGAGRPRRPCRTRRTRQVRPIRRTRRTPTATTPITERAPTCISIRAV